MFLDKLGVPYVPLTEAQKAVARARPFPADFIVGSELLAERATRRETETPVAVAASLRVKSDDDALSNRMAARLPKRKGRR